MDKYNNEVAILVAQTGPLKGKRWAIRNSLVLGREQTCDIVIDDRQVSRQHARIHLTSKGITLEDLGSKNGTHRNGQEIRESIALRDGDVIQIALVQKFVFFSSDATIPLNASDEENSMEEETALNQSSFPGPSGILILDKKSRRVWIQGKEVIPPLSASQFRLLEMLYDNQGKVVPRQKLISEVWGEDLAIEVSEQALDALIRRLRDRLASIDATHTFITTIRGHGLRLDNLPEDSE